MLRPLEVVVLLPLTQQRLDQLVTTGLVVLKEHFPLFD